MTERAITKPVRVAMVVAHPDDETLWAGGTVLMNPEWQWNIVCLCRGDDTDRAGKFHRALEKYGATGTMGNLDDGPEQSPVPNELAQETILSLLGERSYDLILTHSPYGEYTQHRRHEETGRAVASLWESANLKADQLWMFAYQDSGYGGIPDPPCPIHNASQITKLAESIWHTKYSIITQIYGFDADSYEAKIVQRQEAFWQFGSPGDLDAWLKKSRSHL